jgi:hypothetical protein
LQILERLAKGKRSGLIGLIISDEEKRFIPLTPGSNSLKTSFFRHQPLDKIS